MFLYHLLKLLYHYLMIELHRGVHFSDQEIWNTAIFMSIPSMGILACFILVLLGIINKEPSLIKQNDLLDEMKDVDNMR